MFDIPTDLTVSVVTQIGALAGIVITIILGAKTKAQADRAARDSAVVRLETRNAHSPDTPMRHDMDQILANQEDERQNRQAFEEKVLAKLDRHDKEFRGLREDGVNQWEAINTAFAAANAAVRLSTKQATQGE